MKTILITGGAGFIGANFINFFLKKYNQHRIINLDLLTPAANLDNLNTELFKDQYHFIRGDICDRSLVNKIFFEQNIQGIIHFAAESHVDNSIKDPEKFMHSNVYGTFVLLNAAREKWLKSPFIPKEVYKNSRFHHVSTDEVYGALGETGYFTEKSAYAPNSPYSASKASSDMFVRSYHHTYGLNVTISNCSNNYGPFQNDEKFIPTIIRSALAGKDIPIYGSGKNIRDWLFVEDHCEAIDLVYHEACSGEQYVIGGNTEKTNFALANTICSILDKLQPKACGKSYREQIKFVQDRLGHDSRYAINCSKIFNDLGWKTDMCFEKHIQTTVAWFINNYKDLIL